MANDVTLKYLLFGQDVSASRSVKGVARAAEESNKRIHDAFSKVGSDLATVGTRVGSIMTVAGAAGPALLAVGASLSALAAGGTAVAGAIGPAAVAGLAAYGGVALAGAQGLGAFKFAMAGVTDAAAGNAEAMKKLTPAGQAFAKTLHGLSPQLDKIRSSVQAGLFPGLDAAVTRLSSRYLPLLNTAAKQTGSVLGGLARQAGVMASSGPWRSDFATITSTNAKNLGFMGKAALSLADAARSLLVTALPLTQAFTRWAAGAAAAVDTMVQAGRASGDLAAFWTRAGATASVLGSILGNLAAALFNIFQIGASGAGAGMLATVDSITERFRAWTSSANGAQIIGQWFAEGRANLEAMGRLIGAVFGGMQQIGTGQSLAPLIDQVTNQLIPPLMEFLKNASASGALSALVSAVASVVQVFAGLSGTDSSLISFSRTLDILATAAGWIVNNVPGASKAMAAFFIVLGANQALKVVGLGGAFKALSTVLLTITSRLLVAAGATATETGATTLSTVARQAATVAGKAWLTVKNFEIGAWIRTTAATSLATARMVLNTAGMIAAAAASKVFAAGQWLLNAALDANPIGLVIVAIAALVAALVLAYQHSATFRAIVDGAFRAVQIAAAFAFGWIKDHWRLLLAIITGPIGTAVIIIASHWKQIYGGAKTAVTNIKDFFSGLISWFRGAGSKITSATKGLFNGIKSAFRSAMNWVIGKWNGLSFSLPGVTVFGKHIGGATISTPNIPYMKAGGIIAAAGAAVVGDAGPELLTLPRGAQVTPLPRSGAGGGGEMRATLEVIHKTPEGRELQRELLVFKRVNNGGAPLGLA